MADIVYTEEQLANSEKMAQLIESIPEAKVTMFSEVVSAYAKGFEAGCDFKPRAAQK